MPLDQKTKNSLAESAKRLALVFLTAAFVLCFVGTGIWVVGQLTGIYAALGVDLNLIETIGGVVLVSIAVGYLAELAGRSWNQD